MGSDSPTSNRHWIALWILLLILTLNYHDNARNCSMFINSNLTMICAFFKATIFQHTFPMFIWYESLKFSYKRDLSFSTIKAVIVNIVNFVSVYISYISMSQLISYGIFCTYLIVHI